MENKEIENLKELFYSGEYELCYTLMDGLELGWLDLDFNKIMVLDLGDEYYHRHNQKIRNYEYLDVDIYAGVDNETTSLPDRIIDDPNNYTHFDIRFSFPDSITFDEINYTEKKTLKKENC